MALRGPRSPQHVSIAVREQRSKPAVALGDEETPWTKRVLGVGMLALLAASWGGVVLLEHWMEPQGAT